MVVSRIYKVVYIVNKVAYKQWLKAVPHLVQNVLLSIANWALKVHKGVEIKVHSIAVSVSSE